MSSGKSYPATVHCTICGRERTVTVFGPFHVERAQRSLCRSCASRKTRSDFFDGPCRPYAKQYEPDQTAIDWVIVERLISGHTPANWRASTRAERVAAVARMTAMGMPSALIAERMKVSQRTVVRLRVTIREMVSAVA